MKNKKTVKKNNKNKVPDILAEHKKLVAEFQKTKGRLDQIVKTCFGFDCPEHIEFSYFPVRNKPYICAMHLTEDETVSNYIHENCFTADDDFDLGTYEENLSELRPACGLIDEIREWHKNHLDTVFGAPPLFDRVIFIVPSLQCLYRIGHEASIIACGLQDGCVEIHAVAENQIYANYKDNLDVVIAYLEYQAKKGEYLFADEKEAGSDDEPAATNDNTPEVEAA